MAPAPTFEDFYEAVHDRTPFPWQARLARRVVEKGWPDEIGVPTGLGKTAAIDIAVWALSIQADLEPSERTMPTRVWYVVNRRLLVDAASEHSARLGRLLSDPEGSVDVYGGSKGRRALAKVADALRRIGGGDSEPLFVRRLRGGSGERTRPAHPAQPAVICSTVPMYGSRLLFRGYGASRSMWPIEAALAGVDSLVLLDEAHLSRPLQRLVALAGECDARRTGVLRAPGRFQPVGDDPLLPTTRMAPVLVSLTATGSADSDRFDLGEADRKHPAISRRLAAAKPTELVETTSRRLGKEIAAQLVELVGSKAAAAVGFVNSPATAREVAAEVRRSVDSDEADVLMLTGQVRDPEAERLRQELLDPHTGVRSTPDRLPRSRTLYVVATQTLEVGADVDFDVLVTESAGVRALTQRLGRLNRLGVRPHARAALVHPTDRKDGGLYGDEPQELWERLTPLPQPLDLSPGSVAEVLGEPRDEPPYMPELLPLHMWEFAKTAVPPADAAPPDVFVSGLEEAGRRVSVCWRAVLPELGEAPIPRVTDQEFVEVPIWEARAFLETIDADVAVVLDYDGFAQSAVPGVLRTGGRIVVSAAAGGYALGWEPESRDAVLDLSPYLYGELLIEEVALVNLLGRPLSDDERALLARLGLGPDEEPDPDIDAAVAEEVARLVEGVSPPASLPTRLVEGLGGGRIQVERVRHGERVLMRWVSARREADPAVEVLDELSLARPATLDEHSHDVGEAAAAVARAIGVADDYVEAVRQAGRHHDIGKADPRFQRWLDAGDVLMAKSDAPRWRWDRLRAAAGWPRGGRHELIGLQLMDGMAPFAEPELVRHLVASHHGWGRPLIPAVEDPAPISIDAEVLGMRLQGVADPGVWLWDQADRFRELCERFGYWALALLEAIVRQADHHVSAISEVQ